MSTKVFLSFAAADRAFAMQVAEGLKNSGIDIWVDAELGTGDGWVDQLQNNLRDSDAVLVVLSDASSRSSNVLMELGAAMALKKRVVGLKHEADLPSALVGLDVKTLDVARLSAGDVSRTIQAELAA